MTRTLVPDAPFHRLGSRDRRGSSWLSLLFVIGMLGGVGALALSVAAGWSLATGREMADPLGDGEPGSLAAAAVGFGTVAVLLPLVLLAVRWVQERPAGGLSSVTGRLRWGWLGRCVGVAVLAVAAMAGAMHLVVPDDGTAVAWVGVQRFALTTAALLPLVALQSAAEEYLFRGWLLQAFGSVLRSPVVPILAQAVVFAALHGWGTPWGFLNLTWLGIVAGVLCLRTGGIEAAVALHVANNGAALVFATATGLLDLEETAADSPWQAAVVSMVAITAYAAVVLRWSRRRGLAARSAPAPALALAA